MKNPFDYTSASWVKYSQYEWKKAADGNLYLTPTQNAEPKSYDPLKNAGTLVPDALDIALLCFHKKPETEIQSAIPRFARKYGLLGIMTALPTRARFMEYKKVYFLKNQFITAEAMDTTECVSIFFPFKKLDFSIIHTEHFLRKGYNNSKIRRKAGNVKGKEVEFKNRDRFIELGLTIAALRKMQGMSQEQLAEKAMMSHSSLWRMFPRSVRRGGGLPHSPPLLYNFLISISPFYHILPPYARILNAVALPERMFLL